MIKIYLVVNYTEGTKSPLFFKFILDFCRFSTGQTNYIITSIQFIDNKDVFNFE